MAGELFTPPETYVVSPALSVLLKPEPAIMLQEILNRVLLYGEGDEPWLRASLRELSQLFPFLHVRTLQRHLDTLKQDGLMVKQGSDLDRTALYSVSLAAYNIVPYGQIGVMHLDKLSQLREVQKSGSYLHAKLAQCMMTDCVLGGLHSEISAAQGPYIYIFLLLPKEKKKKASRQNGVMGGKSKSDKAPTRTGQCLQAWYQLHRDHLKAPYIGVRARDGAILKDMPNDLTAQDIIGSMRLFFELGDTLWCYRNMGATIPAWQRSWADLLKHRKTKQKIDTALTPLEYPK